MRKFLLTLLCVFAACSVYAQQHFDAEEYYDKAVKANQNGNRNDARKYLKMVIEKSDDYGLRKMAEEFYNKIDTFGVSEDKLNISPYGDFKEIIVSTNDAWTCRSSVAWCKIVEKTGNYIKIWCEENPDYVSRTGFILISRGDKDVRVEVEQDPGKEKQGRIYFRTEPYNAILETDGYMGLSSSPLVLGVGEFNVKVSKEGYFSKDTLIVIKEVADSTIMVDVELMPMFGKLRPVVVDENGRQMESVDFKIGKHSVDISDYANSHSFDDTQPIAHYGFYNDGAIPLNPSIYEVSVSARGYQPQSHKVTISSGQTTELKVVMKSMLGKLKIVDGGNAEGARVDIPELGVRAKVGETVDVVEGIYDLNVRKKGYKWDNAQYDVEILEGKTVEYSVRMTRQVYLYVSTTNKGETVYLNGARLKYQEPYYSCLLDEGESYKLEIKKEGCWHHMEEFIVGKDDVVIDRRNLTLEPVAKLRLRSDEPLNVVLKRKGDQSEQDYAGNASLSGVKGKNKTRVEYTEFSIPYGKYNVVLTRKDGAVKKGKHRLAYKGVINMNDTLENRRLRTWMIPNFGSMSLFDVEYNMTYESLMSSGKIPFVLRANFMDFPLAKGLSTSIAEASVLYTMGSADLPVSLPYDHYTVMMPAFSLPFMNYDFRIGGGMGQYLDISALFSYTYYLQFEKLLSKYVKQYSSFMDHFEGHEVFAGLEVSSRFRGFNMYVRAGFQYVNGNRCYSYRSICDELGQTLEMVELNQSTFVVNVGFNIGHFGVKRKGHNILRVF